MSDAACRNLRVRFKHSVRVCPADGALPIRTLTTNLSARGMFLRMPEPFAVGTRLAISLEAAGQALPFVEAEVAWARPREAQRPGRYAGAGLRFVRFLHPRAEALALYLVENLDRGRPLQSAPRPRRWRKPAGAAVALAAAAGLAIFFNDSTVEEAPPPIAAAAQPAAASPEEVPEPEWLEPAVEEEETAEERAVAPNEAEGSLALPSGAAQAVSWALASSELRVAIDGGQLKRHFVLGGPPRVVFDVDGTPPLRSHTVAGAGPFIKNVRIGRQGDTTRVVVDLKRWPRDVFDDGDAVILSF